MAKYAPITEDDGFFLGEDKVLRFTTVNAADQAVNINGWTIEFALRKSKSSIGDPLVAKSTAAGIAITNAAAGIYEVEIARADTDDLNPGTYYYTTRRTDADNNSVLSHGECVLQQGAAR